MKFSGELSIPLGWIDDPMASALHMAGALWFAWQAMQLIGQAGEARRRAAALAVFVVSAIAVLTISATYHALPASHDWKAFMQRMDHAAIFLLIAGTLTALHAVGFWGAGRWWMVGVIWVITWAALAGKIAWWSAFGDGVGLGLYVGLSIVGLSSVLFLPRKLPWRAFAWMGAGALVYVGGALLDLYGIAWVVPGVFGPHEIWHVAVVGALVLHWRFFHDWSAPGRVPARVPSGIVQSA